MLIGLICLIIGIMERINLNEEIYNDKLSNGIECNIISVNEGTLCYNQRDKCIAHGYDGHMTNGGPGYTRPKNGGPSCEEWSYLHFYYYDYRVAISATDICTNQEMIENEYHNDSLIIFDFTNDGECQFPVMHEVGDHFCFNVDIKCGDTTFELDEPIHDEPEYIQDCIIGGISMLILGTCCCFGWIGYFKWM